MANNVYGPNSPGTMSQSSGADRAWTNLNNAKVSDSSNAITTPPLSFEEVTDDIKATNFGFSIPSGDTITGIKFEIQRSADNNAGVDFDSKALKAGVKVGSLLWAAGWPSTEEYSVKGDSTSLHNTTWTPSDINDTDFGFFISVTGQGQDVECRVNHMRVTVYTTSVDAKTPVHLMIQGGI
jgi:hypothetical protein